MKQDVEIFVKSQACRTVLNVAHMVSSRPRSPERPQEPDLGYIYILRPQGFE